MPKYRRSRTIHYAYDPIYTFRTACGVGQGARFVTTSGQLAAVTCAACQRLTAAGRLPPVQPAHLATADDALALIARVRAQEQESGDVRSYDYLVTLRAELWRWMDDTRAEIDTRFPAAET